jgi:C1A family cysteine protease
VSKFIPKGLGWIPDMPDPRDYTYRHKEILPILQQLKPSSGELPDEVDLRYGDEGEVFFTDVEDQGSLNSSTAFAVLSLVEYFERRLHGHTFDGSKLFLYKVTRNLRNKKAKVTGDTGADLRTTLKALCRFGVPDEEHWPYDLDRFDDEPGAFVYQAVRRFPDLRYFRIVSPFDANAVGHKPTQWDILTSFLASGLPIALGFSVPSSISTDANISFRPEFDAIRGGQAALAIGYRLNHFGRGQHAMLIRSSWGSSWGDNGYGWLPVGFIRQHLARDFWCLISEDWLDSLELSRPSVFSIAE